MQILSALDAVTPAIARTRLVLFTPFRAGRTWKLCATAYLTLGGMLFMPFPFLYLAGLPLIPSEQRSTFVPLLIGAAVIMTVVYAVVFYLCSRLDFAFFDIVLNRGEFVAPAWRKYGPQSARWTLLKAAISLVASALMAFPMAAYMRHFAEIIHQFMQLTPGQPPPIELIFSIYQGYGLIMLLLGTAFLLMSTLNAFILPSLALENVTIGEAFRRFGGLIRREPGQVLGFVAVKTGIGIAGYMGLIFAMELVVFIVIFIFAIVLGLAGFLLHLLGVPTPVLIALAILFGLLLYAFVLVYGMMLAIGPLFTFMQAYTLYFLGGRYPLLGEMLERSTPIPLAPPHAHPPIYSPSAYTVAQPVAPPTSTDHPER